MANSNFKAEAKYPELLLKTCKDTKDRYGNGDSTKIKTDADLEYAQAMLVDIKRVAKDADDQRKELTLPFRDGASEINALFKPFSDWAAKFERATKNEMGRYQTEQLRKAAAKQAEADAKARRERERLEARAEKAAEKGNMEKAEVLSEQADELVADEVKVEKVAGQRYIWQVEVTDPKALIAHALNVNPMLLSAIKVDETQLKKFAQTVGDPNIEIPGVNVTRKLDFSIRT